MLPYKLCTRDVHASQASSEKRRCNNQRNPHSPAPQHLQTSTTNAASSGRGRATTQPTALSHILILLATCCNSLVDTHALGPEIQLMRPLLLLSPPTSSTARDLTTVQQQEVHAQKQKPGQVCGLPAGSTATTPSPPLHKRHHCQRHDCPYSPPLSPCPCKHSSPSRFLLA